MTIWQFNAQLTSRLLQWALVNLVGGIVLLPSGAFWRAFGLQAFGWGIVNAAIALLGGAAALDRAATQDTPAVRTQEARNLRRLLWINAGLDLLYIWGGRKTAERRRANAGLRGTGWGIVVQGMFLFFFDVYHALRVPASNP